MSMTGGRRKAYGLAVALCVLALAMSLGIERFSGAPSYVLFVAAVAVAAWRWGRGPALLASGIAVLAIDYFILPPTGSIELTQPEQAANSLAFVVVTLVVSSITAALRRSNASLARASEESGRMAEGALALQQVTAALSGATTMAEVSRAVLKSGRDMLRAEGGTLVMKREGSDELTLHVLAPGATEPAAVDIVEENAVDHTRLLFALRTGQPVWDERCVAHPLIERETVAGAIAFEFARPTHYTVTERTLIQLLAQATVTAMSRAGSFDVERQRRHEAEVLAQAREEVLGVVAHDLRNPLHLIASSAEMLAEADTDLDQRRKFADVAKRATAQMNRLIADLLDMTRLSAGRLSLELDVVAVGTLFEQAEETFRSIARARQVKLEVQRDTTDLRVRADAGRVLQVIGNLLGNGLKFTPPGGRVSLTATRPMRGDGTVVFAVADTGPGIPSDALGKLFDRFWQARGGDRSGVGLGLTISKGIVEAHGGRIWCESKVGTGSTFYFTLPAADHGAVTGARSTDSRAETGPTDPAGSTTTRKQRSVPDLLPR
jgi:K+-sensing histidine kinase KdpD